MTIGQLLELGSWRCDALMATTGTQALRKGTALVAEPLSGPLWKNGRFQEKVMLEVVGAFTPRQGPELFDAAQADAGKPAQREYRTSVTTNQSPRHSARQEPPAHQASSAARRLTR
jgi:hypothetical protein